MQILPNKKHPFVKMGSDTFFSCTGSEAKRPQVLGAGAEETETVTTTPIVYMTAELYLFEKYFLVYYSQGKNRVPLVK